ncbi:bifunctional adenosylcobinamide kinase/adenosylcobinamide-phosphate guanylyltransferase [Corynebacterium mendelii]|uniref:Adenosylcobinamide kinase n=1 Tax=Corynebacterium mendelii TaxID=2765362 RepID=A0A939DXJ8_9CORY|nr:bifunctional adenosylcobinamide kinase/adenosylcobinamide-phosphate guanylyltransferase [Corynebacterium mendelii]MBN9643060.1 bifunctional adenosylcobinamide kinase/adenosylcobinamide-phosphate guanylyltransferase [Corynebacterium mendelii]
MRTLILGGARSGKSARAEYLAGGIGRLPVTYVATARPWPGDDDFADRIAAHRRRRPAEWTTIDNRDAVDVLTTPPDGVVLVDDLGTWLTFVLDQHDAWDKPRGTVSSRTSALVKAVAEYPADPDHHLVLVSPEVGLSVIPEHASARLFRDELGQLNAGVAAACDRVELVVAGCRLSLKG